MSKYSKNINNNNNVHSTSSCFSNILQRIICTGNLPTHPSPHDHQILKKPEKRRSFSRPLTDVNGTVLLVQAQVQVDEAKSGPGVIARLMGLDSLPNNYESITTLDSLFRSKSLNSLHFLPDFDPTRAAFHRRARTSSSFHEQSRNHNFYVTRDGSLEAEMKPIKKGNKSEAGLNTNNNECTKIRQNGGRIKKRYEERYTSSCSSVGSNSNSNLREKRRIEKRKIMDNNNNKLNGKVVGSTIVSSKRKVDHKKKMCIEVRNDDLLLPPSPVSVLDHSNKEVNPFFKGEGRQITSNSRRKRSPKSNKNDNLPREVTRKSEQNHQECRNRFDSKQEVVKAEIKAVDCFVEMLSNICKFAEEEHMRDSKWVKRYELSEVHFAEDLSIHLGQELLDLLLDELLDEMKMM